MIKIGIIGFGYMGHFHLNKAKEFSEVKVTCAFDNNSEKLIDAEKEGLKAYDNLEDFCRKIRIL
jgi:predicted dehydrogenase